MYNHSISLGVNEKLGKEPILDRTRRKGPKKSTERKKEKCDGRGDGVILGGLKCMQMNAESLTNKMDEFRAIVAKTKPDIVGVTETWAKEVKSDQWYKVEGYQCSLLEVTMKMK